MKEILYYGVLVYSAECIFMKREIFSTKERAKDFARGYKDAKVVELTPHDDAKEMPIPEKRKGIDPTKIDRRFEEVTAKMSELYHRKNADYGNSFDQSMGEWGLPVAAIRIGDKCKRLAQLSKNNGQQVKDESVKDTLMDLANYAVMAIMWMEKQENKGQEAEK